MAPSSALRRVVPPGYQVFELTLTGVTPLLMSSAEADRRGETFLAFQTLSRKRGKTPTDEARLRELEFYVRMYYDEETGPYIPGGNVKEMLRSAATKIRKGEDIRRSLIIPAYRIPLLYEGPRTPHELWKESRFAYTTMVANAGPSAGRVERTRPMFEEWALTTELAIDPEELSEDELRYSVDRSVKYGLGDRRPDYGSFVPTLTFQREQHKDAEANGAKSRDEVLERVNKARTEALMQD